MAWLKGFAVFCLILMSFSGFAQDSSKMQSATHISISSQCSEIIDDAGFTRIRCNTSQCPSLNPNDKRIVHDKCQQIGSGITIEKDINGCEYYSCIRSKSDNPLQKYSTCPSESDINTMLEKCKIQGFEAYMEKSGGCLIPTCKVVPVKYDAFNIKDECIKRGGEYVEKEENGKIVFSQCIKEASKDDVQVNPVDKVPETADLLQLAFKLETLKVEFDNLASKSESLADYYQSIGDTESSNRFNRVSSMFLSAKDEADKIKLKIAEKSSQKITKKDILEIRHDINYLKDVVLKNILYEMLGSKERITGSSACDDSDCFDDAIVTCNTNVIYESEDSFKATIKGVEKDRCVILIEKDGLEMTCRIPNYALGIRDPETQVMPYCEGKLLNEIKTEKKNNVVVSASIEEKIEENTPGNCGTYSDCKVYCTNNKIDGDMTASCKEYFGKKIEEMNPTENQFIDESTRITPTFKKELSISVI